METRAEWGLSRESKAHFKEDFFSVFVLRVHCALHNGKGDNKTFDSGGGGGIILKVVQRRLLTAYG